DSAAKTPDFDGQATVQKVELTPASLAKVTPFIDDDFRDPRESVLRRTVIAPDRELLHEEGLYVGMMRPWPGISQRQIYCGAAKCLSADFACQATGRVLADNDEGWMIYLVHLNKDRFVAIRVNRNREIEIADAPKDGAYYVTKGPFRN